MSGKKSPKQDITYDFLIRTALERESSGKRPIRPKPVDDILRGDIAEESDDPDYSFSGHSSGSEQNLSEDAHSKSDDDSEKSEDEDSASQSDDTSESEDDTPQKKSALKETWEKANMDEFQRPIGKKKKKRPSKKKTGGDKKTKAKKSKSTKNIKVKDSKKKTSSKRKHVSDDEDDDDEDYTDNQKKSVSSLIRYTKEKSKRTMLDVDLQHLICSACLGSNSDASNEIIECDSCCITVHEGCYGVSDSISGSSGSHSSCSTEPWFCDACKQVNPNIACELCPVKGGLFKETPGGRWVHLVCALYTPGIFVDAYINLFNVSYTRWGAHLCSACENDKYSRTGICIACDAGFCKTYFHAMCAQKYGLLSEPALSPLSQAEADPYYGACKQHTNRENAKRRTVLYNTLQEQLRLKRERKNHILTYADKINQERNARKLGKIRSKIAQKQAKNPPIVVRSPLSSPNEAWNTPSVLPYDYKATQNQKKPRLLQTFSGAVEQHLRKAERAGWDVKALELEEKHNRIVTNVKKKWNVLPSMGVEFAAYYSDRETRITAMKKQCVSLDVVNKKLYEKQEDLTDKYDTQEVNNMAMAEETENITHQLLELKNTLKKLCPTNKKFITSVGKLIPPKPRNRSPKSPGRSDRGSASPVHPGASKPKKSRSRKNSSPSGRLAIVKCFVCNQSDDQHMITRCDKCKKHYHLRCLDPPLTRMPKKTRLFGWMCSDCCETDTDEDEAQIDADAPRTLRGRTKIRKPGKYRKSEDSDGGGMKGTKVKNGTRKKKSKGNAKKKNSANNSQQNSEDGKILSGNCVDQTNGEKSARTPNELLTVSTSFLIDGTTSSPMNSSITNMNGITELPKVESNDVQLSLSSDDGNYIKLHYDMDDCQSQNSSGSINDGGVKSVKCSTCQKMESKKFAVSCDKCEKWFHFTCLNPPLKYSPKRRGYSWYCSNCDEDEPMQDIKIATTQENGIEILS